MSVSYGGDSITFADGSVQSGGWTGMRNRIINGAMVIDQRNAGASFTPTAGSYSIDRWTWYVSQSSKLTTQQSTVAPLGFSNSMLVTSSSAYSVISTDYNFVRQAIEGFNTADLMWGTANAQPITLSFWVRSSLTGTWGGQILSSNSGSCYVYSYTINQANTWEYKTITIPGPTSYTWYTDNRAGMYVSFNLGAGSSRLVGSTGWVATIGAGADSVTGSQSLVGTSGATWYLTGVQVERGSTASSFEYRPYTTELQLCQRYFQKSYDILVDKLGTVTTTGEVRWVSSAVAGEAAPTVMLPVVMRTTPTITFYSPNNGASGFVYNYSAATNTAMTGTNVGGSRGWSGGSTAFTAGHIVGYQFAATAEL